MQRRANGARVGVSLAGLWRGVSVAACHGLMLMGVASAQPANDSCMTGVLPAIPPTGGTVLGTTVGSTRDGVIFCSLDGGASVVSPVVDSEGGDVWFTFTPSPNDPQAASSRYIFDLTRTVEQIDHAIAVHARCPNSGDDLDSAIACSGNQSPGGSSAVYGVLPIIVYDVRPEFAPDPFSGIPAGIVLNRGQTYYIKVGGARPIGDEGFFRMDVTEVVSGACCAGNTCRVSVNGNLGCSPAYFFPGLTCSPNPCDQTSRPVNDNCDGSVALTVGTPYYGNARRMTRTYVDAVGPCGSQLPDVMLNVTPATDGIYGVFTCGSAFGIVPTLHTSCPPSNANLVACFGQPLVGDEWCDVGGASSALYPLSLQGGTTYTIRLSRFVGAPGSELLDYGILVRKFDVENGEVTIGACCWIDRTCTLVDQNSTAPCDGVYLGDFTTCGPNVNCAQYAGACCDLGAGCSLRFESECVEQQLGLFQGAGTTCQPANLCSALQGACCVSGGECVLDYESFCIARGNSQFVGAGVACTPTACNVFPSGACCEDATFCNIRFQSGPGSCPPSQFYLGNGTTCAPNICAQNSVSCCLPVIPGFPNQGAHCIAVLGSGAEACTQRGGLFIGVGSVCTPSASSACAANVLGGCCKGTNCIADAFASDCTGPNTKFNANFPMFPTSPSPNVCGYEDESFVVLCCKADFNHVGGITVQDIFDFLASWFAGSPMADFNGNGAGSLTVQDIFDFLAAWFAGNCS